MGGMASLGVWSVICIGRMAIILEENRLKTNDSVLKRQGEADSAHPCLFL